jgi:PAS domain S-box-containing protein
MPRGSFGFLVISGNGHAMRSMNKYSMLSLLLMMSAVLLLLSDPAFANILSYFKDAQGHTNWQYVANWSSGILILLLSVAALFLYSSRRQINIANRALMTANDQLEQRVRERTATLDEANQLLKESNILLEGEINQHLATARLLHASETYIKSILESMPLMLVGLDKYGIVTQWNRGAEEITGLKAEEALNRVLWEAYPIMPVSRDKVDQALAENTTLNMRRSQRDQFHFEITIYPLEGDSETGVVILIDDVTHQVNSENKLIERDKISNMGELASSMAHDINAPLQTIIADIEKAQHLVASNDQRLGNEIFQPLFSLLTDAGDQSQRTAAIINNLLDFAGSQDGDRSPASITEIMDHSLELAASIFSFPQGLKFTDISIIREYGKDLPLVPCFSSELQQVFLSLLRHAFRTLAETKATEPPKIVVNVKESFDALWIKIHHNGRALSAEEQQFIFEPYFSNVPLKKALKKAEQVTVAPKFDAGKHLSFPYFIITEHHEGEMAVTSDVDTGTTFHMQLQIK